MFFSQSKTMTLSHCLFVTFFLLFATQIQSNDNFDPFIAHPVHATFDPNGDTFTNIVPKTVNKMVQMKSTFPTVPPNSSVQLAYSRDILLDSKKNTWVRIYLPKDYLNLTQKKKLPVVVYAHGGGFILLSAGSASSDFFCSRTATSLRAVVVSIEYRLAPASRLPGAYDDSMDALAWVRNGKDEWITKYADLSNCIIMGESSGGNIAYTMGLRASFQSDALKPLVIKGLVLIQPFFGGVKRSPSEARLNKPGPMALEKTTDMCWLLSLPIGATRDDPFSNPLNAHVSNEIAKMKQLGWKVLVLGSDGDPLYDRQVELANWLKKQGVDVREDFRKGFFHGAFGADDALVKQMFSTVEKLFAL